MVCAFALAARAQTAKAPQITAVTNAASFQTSAYLISPGEVVSIFGTNLGPSQALGLELVLLC